MSGTRARLSYTGCALLQALGVALVVWDATMKDDYYASGDVTRWHHASGGGSAPEVVGGLVVVSAIALAFLLQGLFPRRRILRPLGVPAYTFSIAALVISEFFLSLGH